MASFQKILTIVIFSLLFNSCCDCEKQILANNNDSTATQIRFVETKLSRAGKDSLKWYFTHWKIDTTKTFSGTQNAIPDAKTASDIAYPILIKCYGKETIDEELPLRVTSIGSYWLISGTLPPAVIGGTAELLINKKNGTVVRMVHYK